MKVGTNVIVEPKNSLKKVSDEKDKNQKILRQNEAEIGCFSDHPIFQKLSLDDQKRF